MALSPAAAHAALIAFQRFGLGAKPGGPAAIGADPKAALLAEINAPDVAAISDPSLPTYAEAAREGTFTRERATAVQDKEIHARVDKHISADIGFVERLVLFWSNHFSMSAEKDNIIRSTLGQLERDVIRKHVLGNFSAMLDGVIAHPAMIAYLDNASSIGPGSIVGLSSTKGSNENLAREILELHTLGSGGGQTEADIRAFTRILTGWSLVSARQAESGKDGGTQENRGQFIFRANWHERDPIAMMGKIYPDEGQKQARMVFADLTKHRSTAEHIALKLVQHFITDEPTPAMVDPIRNAFQQSRGDLKAVAAALINLPEAWSTPLAKIRTPYELSVAQFRALGHRYTEKEYRIFISVQRVLQQSLWECPAPTGYPDHTRDWLNPDGMKLRLDTALLAAGRWGARLQGSPVTVARRLYDAALTKQTRDRMGGAGDTTNALTILFSSPEFQRR